MAKQKKIKKVKLNKKQLRANNETLAGQVIDLTERLRVTEEGRQAWHRESDIHRDRAEALRSEVTRVTQRYERENRELMTSHGNEAARLTREKDAAEAGLITLQARFDDALEVLAGVKQWIDSTDVTLQEVFNEAGETLSELLPNA